MNSNIAYRFEDVAIARAKIDSAHRAMTTALATWSATRTPAASLAENLERNGFLTMPAADGGLRIAGYAWPRAHLEDVVLESIAPFLSPGGRIVRQAHGQTVAYVVDGGHLVRCLGVTWSQEQRLALVAS